MTLRMLSVAALLALLPTPALGGTLALTVRDASGAPVRDAVVSVDSKAGAKAAPGTVHQVQQKDIRFDPYVIVVPVGASVAFPNRDKVRHHVYSFSKPKKFELKLYGRDERHSILFDKPGVVALGCNIHDGMTAFVKVVDTPFAAKTDADGAVRLDALPAGAATVRIWHPHLRGAGNELVRSIAVPASGAAAQVVAVEMRRPAG